MDGPSRLPSKVEMIPGWLPSHLSDCRFQTLGSSREVAGRMKASVVIATTVLLGPRLQVSDKQLFREVKKKTSKAKRHKNGKNGKK